MTKTARGSITLTTIAVLALAGVAGCGSKDSSSSTSATTSAASGTATTSASTVASSTATATASTTDAATTASASATDASAPASTSAASSAPSGPQAKGTRYTFTLPEGFSKDTSTSRSGEDFYSTGKHSDTGVGVVDATSAKDKSVSTGTLLAIGKKTGLTKLSTLPSLTLDGESAQRVGGYLTDSGTTQPVQLWRVRHQGHIFMVIMTDKASSPQALTDGKYSVVAPSWHWTN